MMQINSLMLGDVLMHFRNYFVANDQESRMANIKANVSLLGQDEILYGIKYFAVEEEATLFTEMVGEFLSDALDDFDLRLVCQIGEIQLIWPLLNLNEDHAEGM